MNGIIDKLKQNEFTKWYTICVTEKFAKFEGRARRKEYWMFTLVNIIVTFILGFILGIIGLPILVSIYSLAMLVPGIAAAVRRMHDIGKSGWWLLIALVPLVGGLVLLYFMILDSKPGVNQYGPNPKGL